MGTGEAGVAALPEKQQQFLARQSCPSVMATETGLFRSEKKSTRTQLARYLPSRD